MWVPGDVSTCCLSGALSGSSPSLPVSTSLHHFQSHCCSMRCRVHTCSCLRLLMLKPLLSSYISHYPGRHLKCFIASTSPEDMAGYAVRLHPLVGSHRRSKLPAFISPCWDHHHGSTSLGPRSAPRSCSCSAGRLDDRLVRTQLRQSPQRGLQSLHLLQMLVKNDS